MGRRVGYGAEGILRQPQRLAVGLALGAELTDDRALDWLQSVLSRAVLRPAAEGEFHPTHCPFRVVQHCSVAGGVARVVDKAIKCKSDVQKSTVAGSDRQ